MSGRLSILLVLLMIAIGTLTGCQLMQPQIEPTATASAEAGSSDPDEALRAFAQCMRDNGVPNFPEPTEDGISLSGTGLDPDSPEFKLAAKACESLRPAPLDDSADAGDSEWEQITPGGDCMCADGSQYSFWERLADPTKVVFYLDGGGICFDAATCAQANTPTSGERAGPDYDPNVEGENPAREGGMLDFSREDNPFRDYSFIYVPQCTGDTHLGSVTREYSPDLTVEHKGFVNGTASLTYLAEHYPDAIQVVVVGHTTGAAPIYGGLVSDLLPDAQVIVFGSQSGAVPDDPDLNAEVLGQWGTFETMPDWEVNEGLTARDWGIQRFWIQAGLHDPDIIMARFDYAFDPHAVEALEYWSITGIDPSNPLAVIDANEAAIEEAGVVLHSYTAPGEGHGILEFNTLYEMEVNGVRLIDWIAALIAGEPLDDVHCDDCGAE